MYQPCPRLLLVISTHTSRVGCDRSSLAGRRRLHQFLLTHPVWDVTRNTRRVLCGSWISTHTSRVGCDGFIFYTLFLGGFLLTHPVWDVTGMSYPSGAVFSFLLTHPVWDVTLCFRRLVIIYYISTHTSRVGCDGSLRTCFNIERISTHTSRVGCDCM